MPPLLIWSPPSPRMLQLLALMVERLSHRGATEYPFVNTASGLRYIGRDSLAVTVSLLIPRTRIKNVG